MNFTVINIEKFILDLVEIESALRCELVACSTAVKCFLTGKVEYSLDSRGFNQILQLTLLNHQLRFDYIIALTATVNQIFKLLRVAQHIRFATRWLDRSGKLGNVRIRTWLDLLALLALLFIYPSMSSTSTLQKITSQVVTRSDVMLYETSLYDTCN